MIGQTISYYKVLENIGQSRHLAFQLFMAVEI